MNAPRNEPNVLYEINKEEMIYEHLMYLFELDNFSPKDVLFNIKSV